MRLLAIHKLPKNDLTIYVVDELGTISEMEKYAKEHKFCKFFTEKRFRELWKISCGQEFKYLELLCMDAENILWTIAEEDIIEVYV